MNVNENDLWRDKTELLNLRLYKLPNAKVLLKVEFDTKDQVFFFFKLFGGLFGTRGSTKTADFLF